MPGETLLNKFGHHRLQLAEKTFLKVGLLLDELLEGHIGVRLVGRKLLEQQEIVTVESIDHFTLLLFRSFVVNVLDNFRGEGVQDVLAHTLVDHRPEDRLLFGQGSEMVSLLGQIVTVLVGHQMGVVLFKSVAD